MKKFKITYLRGTSSITLEATDSADAARKALARYRASRAFVDPLPLEKVVLNVEAV